MVEVKPGSRNIKVITTPVGAVTRVENEAGVWFDARKGMGANKALERAQVFQGKNPEYALEVVDISKPH